MIVKRKRNLHAILAVGLSVAALSSASEASCSNESHLGAVCMTASTFCPRGTAEAKGQLLPISQNAALFSLLGTRFGGDGRNTFSLPDLQTAAPISAGSGEGVAIKYCIVMQGIYPSRP